MDIDEALQIVRAAGYKVSKPRARVERRALNAVGKPYSPQFDPDYKVRHHVTPIGRLRWEAGEPSTGRHYRVSR